MTVMSAIGGQIHEMVLRVRYRGDILTVVELGPPAPGHRFR
jgi:hypothetical protein